MEVNSEILKKATLEELLDERDRCLTLLGAIEAELYLRGAKRLSK